MVDSDLELYGGWVGGRGGSPRLPTAPHGSPLLPVHTLGPVQKCSILIDICTFACSFLGNEFNITLAFIFSDDMGPQVLFCPASFTARATAMTAIVNWDAPIFKDNSLGLIEPQCNRQSGDRFYWGDWNIYCRAYDNNPNNEPAVCNFVVTVKRKRRHFTIHWVLAHRCRAL